MTLRTLVTCATVVACACGQPDATASAEAASIDGGTEGGGDGVDEGAGVPVPPILVIRDNPDMANAPFADVSAGVGTVIVRVFRDGAPVREYEPVHGSGAFAWLWGLSADTQYEAEAEASLDGQSASTARVAFTTGSLPEGTLQPDVVIHEPGRAHEGLVAWSSVTEPERDIVYIGIDPAGEVLWYHDLGAFGGDSFSGDVVPVAGGRFLLYTLKGARLIEPWGATVLEVQGAYHHHIEPLPNGNFVFMQRRTEQRNVPALGGTVEIKADGLVELTRDGATVTQWWASDHLDTQRFPSQLSSEPTEQGHYDWSHANAAVYDAGQRQMLVSLRHQHWVIGVDWPSGDVAWRLGAGGDFVLINGGADDWFYAQHQPELQPDGTLLLFDNGNDRPGVDFHSRGVQLSFSPSAGTAALLWTHRLEPLSSSLGDADRLDNGNVLLVAGGVVTPGTPRLVEVDPEGEVVWEVEVPRTYRATHIETHAGVWP